MYDFQVKMEQDALELYPLTKLASLWYRMHGYKVYPEKGCIKFVGHLWTGVYSVKSELEKLGLTYEVMS